MNVYEFTLRFRLPGVGADAEQYVKALDAAGCDDAIVGIGQPGCIALMFDREARSAFHAIASAVHDVKRAIPGAELVDPTL